jgi:hypothetical protein
VGVGNLRYANQDCSNSVLSGNTSYTISRFFKYDGVDFQTTMEANSAAQFGGVGWIQRINIASTGVTLGVSTNCTGSIENYGNGWYRVSARITTGASPSGSPVQYLMALPSGLLTGEGMLTALPQFEVGSVPTSYIPTTTGSVTRAADVVEKTGVSGLIGQTEGTLYIECENVSAANDVFYLNKDSTNTVRITKDASNIFTGTIRASGVSTPFVGASGVTGIVKIAIAYKSGDSAMYLNGLQVGTTSSDAITFSAALSKVTLSDSSFFAGKSPTRIRAAAIYKTRLPNYLLESATSQIQSYSALASSLSYTVV